ncbi:Glycerophosphoryl diester phosphodiesterase family protein [Aliiruegeria lutimaris]|uniref:Glycerophosphoryl diester phosphodiesterase family protein n=2 Tax=Aliiruegeria lutimaris TaxID=571298 RepID=A0A1G9C453_9RHOB|nr:Glycerophosphoryl diester phosphodiesterase family protein [Aliiruegeria lutimaris]
MIHLNPQLTADGHYVLMHDQTLNRTTNVELVFSAGPPGGPTREQRGGKDYVGDFTLDEIRQLRVVGENIAGAYPIPTLDEALDLIDRRLLVSLGLKSYDVESLATTLENHETRNLLLFELYYPGTTQTKLREMADLSGLGVAVVMYGSTDYLADLEAVAGQLGAHLQMVVARSKGLTPEFLGRLEDLDLHLAVSGWASNEDHALVERNDPAPWLSVLEGGHSVLTSQPEAVLELLGR